MFGFNWQVFLVLEALVVIQVFLAHRMGFLSPAQMHRQGIMFGMPLIGHGGMWSDAILISLLCAFLAGTYHDQWRVGQRSVMFLLAMALSWVMHEAYKLAQYPEAHVQSGVLTAAGQVHAVYMTIAFTVIGLFLFVTREVKTIGTNGGPRWYVFTAARGLFYAKLFIWKINTFMRWQLRRLL